jgi:hypothetical protein
MYYVQTFITSISPRLLKITERTVGNDLQGKSIQFLHHYNYSLATFINMFLVYSHSKNISAAD